MSVTIAAPYAENTCSASFRQYTDPSLVWGSYKLIMIIVSYTEKIHAVDPSQVELPKKATSKGCLGDVEMLRQFK